MIHQFKLNLQAIIQDFKVKKYLLAVSGGVDSIALAHLFYSSGLDFALAHCNFQLRGVESDADERLVSIFAQRANKKIHIKRFDTIEYVENHKVSIQMAARTLRYDWFDSLADIFQYDYIVTAHHLNDLAETMLLNICKGTGHAGLVGIHAAKGNLIRPLLAFEKKDILMYATQHDLLWREDESNGHDKYQRNHLRLNVFPLLAEVNPQINAAFARTSEKMASANAFIHQMIIEAYESYCTPYKNGLDISFELVDRYRGNAGFVLSEILKPYGFDYQKCMAIAAHDLNSIGTEYLGEKYSLVIDREKYVVFSLSIDKNMTQIFNTVPDSFDFGGHQFSCIKITVEDDMKFEKNELVLPIKHLQAPLTIRYPKEGDTIKPFGMGGKKKKVADLMNDAKVPLNIKNYIPIFQIDSNIIWVMGVRTSEICKVQKGDEALIIKIL